MNIGSVIVGVGVGTTEYTYFILLYSIPHECLSSCFIVICSCYIQFRYFYCNLLCSGKHRFPHIWIIIKRTDFKQLFQRRSHHVHVEGRSGPLHCIFLSVGLCWNKGRITRFGKCFNGKENQFFGEQSYTRRTRSDYFHGFGIQ